MENNKLRLVLKVNAIFSAISGLTLMFLNQWLANLMNISNSSILLVIGIGLVLFGGSVYWSAVQENISIKKIKLIIIQDWMWVVGSAVIILSQGLGINRIGFIIIGIVALIVADFAILQQKYLPKNV